MERIIGVTGADGNVGKELVKRGCVPIRCEITDVVNTTEEVLRINPDVIIHCAAMTSVHECEKDPDKAFNVNVRGTLNVADEYEGLVILISSDHVFPQASEQFRPNGHTELDRPIPQNVYGMTKYAAEQSLMNMRLSIGKSMIIRTSKLFTTPDLRAMKFRLFSRKGRIEVTDLVKRSFLHVEHFADALLYVIDHHEQIKEHLIHIAGTEIISYHELWQSFCNVNGLEKQAEVLLKKRTVELKDADPRPLRGGLDVSLARKLEIPVHSYKENLRLES